MTNRTHENLFVCGPLHPDLFGGETPILLPIEDPNSVYRVEVCWDEEAVQCHILYVLADNENDAAGLALRFLHAGGLDTDLEVVDVQKHNLKEISVEEYPSTSCLRAGRTV
jgi:hypothetical protein